MKKRKKTNHRFDKLSEWHKQIRQTTKQINS